jgi:hypothetical protein
MVVFALNRAEYPTIFVQMFTMYDHFAKSVVPKLWAAGLVQVV